MTKQPDKDKVVERRGRKAYRDGIPFKANPEHGLNDWQAWRRGWLDEEVKAKKKGKKP